MSRIRVLFICAVGGFMLWWMSLLRQGLWPTWVSCAVMLSALTGFVVVTVQRRRSRSKYGPHLRLAMTVLTSRRKWADLAEILDLTVVADLRRLRSTRAAFAVLGVARDERRAVRYIPKVVGTRRASHGMVATVLGAPGQSLEGWQRRSGQLRTALRVPQVTVTEPRAGIFELALRVRDPLGEPILLDAAPRAEGWCVPLGVAEDGAPASVSLRNVSGAVVGGVPGGGKSAWLLFALASLAHRDDVQWLVIDGKQGYDLEALASRAYQYVSGEDAGDLEMVRDSLQDIKTLMRERLRFSRDLYGHSNLWSAGPSRSHPAVIVVIDECQTYLDPKALSSKEAKAVGVEIDSIVRDLVKRGRSAGIVVVLSTQRPTADSIPTSTRDNCGLRVCFSVRTREAATAVLGEFSSGSAVNPIGSPTGVGVSSVDGEALRFRSPFVAEDVIRTHVGATASLAANPLDLLCDALMDCVSQVGDGAVNGTVKQASNLDTSRQVPTHEREV